MYTLHFASTANGFKVLIMLEALGVPFQLQRVNLSQGEQHRPDFARLTPFQKIPVLVEHQQSLVLPESGAILQYLAETHGRFLPSSGPERYQVLQWLAWQISSLGPMAGQWHHFMHRTDDADVYAKERYLKETTRLFHIVEDALAGRDFICSAYSIADMAIYPWLRIHKLLEIDLHDLPRERGYLSRLGAREEVVTAYMKGSGEFSNRDGRW
ncbi:glutathione S-transferase family protein [Pseudomonas sp. Pseusp97]|uniref:glutathione S-transferase family protein n=1 Tax=Pseudomonas sp. Pseusp97 TaxID=3243065 RepID=UPI0039A458CC